MTQTAITTEGTDAESLAPAGPSMRAAVWTAPGIMEVHEVPLPVVPEGWALVKVAANGICGTDLAIWHGAHPRAQTGLIPGHELSGWIARPGASGPAAGQLVAARPLISCGHCGACRSGHAHVCRSLQLYGIDTPGGLAEYVALPPEVLYPVPSGINATAAAWIEPVAVAVHAVDIALGREGAVAAAQSAQSATGQPADGARPTAAVLGVGPIGLLTALVAREAGIDVLGVTDTNAWRRSLAESFGLAAFDTAEALTEAVLAGTDGEGAALTFDAAGHPAVAAAVTPVTRVRGRVIVVGVHKKPAALDLRDVSFKELTLAGVRVYTPGAFEAAIGLMASGALMPPAASAFGLDQVQEAFEAAQSGAECIKAVVTPAA
jgi:threonine dehydrogenase-like Zn-dependent dehydrogenase